MKRRPARGMRVDRSKRRRVAVWSIAMVLTTLASCSWFPLSPRVDDLVGTWRHDDGISTSVLEFNVDGTFDATDIPVSVLDETWALGDGSPEVTFTGEWEMTSGVVRLQLPPESNSRFISTSIGLEGLRPRWRLYFGFGEDPILPNCYLFLRPELNPPESEFTKCFTRG